MGRRSRFTGLRRCGPAGLVWVERCFSEKEIPAVTHTVVRQNWLESERDWGTRPDGFSLHLTDDDRIAYVKAYWDQMPDTIPAEYSRPTGDPFLHEVSEETYQEVLAATKEHGIRRYNEYV